jgi:hypothetical protein
MLSYQKYKKLLSESLDSLSPKEIDFGSNGDFWDDNPYSDKKFSQFIGNLYQTIFKKDGIFFRVLFDKKTSEISFQVSKGEDVTSFNDEKLGKGTEIIQLFSHLLYIIPFIIKQFNPSTLMFSSKHHTLKLYDALFSKSKAINKFLQNVGFEKKSEIQKNSDGSHSYYFEKRKN